jgi:hypothetical protein
MLTVTHAVLERLSRRLARQKAAADVALRFTRQERHWKLRPDTARADDTKFAHEGRTVLLLDQATCQALANLTLDIGDSETRRRFRLSRSPNQGE